jgi:hypothetical protein
MFVVGHLYIEKKSTKIPTINHAAQAFVLSTTPPVKKSSLVNSGLTSPRPD